MSIDKKNYKNAIRIVVLLSIYKLMLILNFDNISIFKFFLLLYLKVRVKARQMAVRNIGPVFLCLECFFQNVNSSLLFQNKLFKNSDNSNMGFNFT